MSMHVARIDDGGGVATPEKASFDSWIMTKRKRVQLRFVDCIGTDQ